LYGANDEKTKKKIFFIPFFLIKYKKKKHQKIYFQYKTGCYFPKRSEGKSKLFILKSLASPEEKRLCLFCEGASVDSFGSFLKRTYANKKEANSNRRRGVFRAAVYYCLSTAIYCVKSHLVIKLCCKDKGNILIWRFL